MRIIIALALLLAACSTSDPTFMGVCELSADDIRLPAANEVDSTACSKPEAITWPAMPLVVAVDGDVAADYSQSVSQAMDFWNGHLDFKAFTTVGAKANVHVVIGSAGDPGDGATSFYRDADGDLVALVELRQPGDVTEVYYIFAHEFGHALGLCHDPDDFLSVMFPKLDYKWDGVDQDGQPVGFRTILITNNDRSALNAKY